VHLGITATDAITGQILLDHNAHQWFVPASNQKILVTAAAWSLLGPDHEFRTELWAAGLVQGNTLEGDLVLVGSGDPSLSSRYWESGSAALDTLAQKVRAAGIRQVTGSLIVDASVWDSTTVAPTREVQDLRFRFGSTGGAFAIDEGEFEVIVSGGPSIGGPGRVRWSPVGTSGYVQSLVTTSPAGRVTSVVPHYLPETRQIVLRGNAEYGTVDTLWIAQRDPVRQATAALAAALAQADVDLAHSWSVRWKRGDRVGRSCQTGTVAVCPDAHLVGSLISPPLSELTAGTLEPSQNWISEQFVHALGAELGDHGSWEEGIAVLESFLVDEVGIDPQDVSARDGSGLSAYNLVTPRAIARVLRYMYTGPGGDTYRMAMAEPGEKGSTLEHRLSGLEGQVFAKTGSISNVNSLSGYLVTGKGNPLIFSILSNGAGLNPLTVRERIDDLVRILAR
tara:strand:+ start:1543 stop:2895 length:1353 start_codon:yes stop_codon:yes gene_type:complete